MVTVSCQECGKEFSAQRTSAKFCSANCRVRFNKRNPESEQKFESYTFLAKKPKGDTELGQIKGFIFPQGLSKPMNEQKDVVEFVKPKPEIQLPKVSGITMGAEVLSNTPKTLFQLLLIEFNDLVLDQPPVSKIKANLEALIEKSQNSELTARQSEAIRERCINYIKGIYGISKPKKD